MKHINDKIVKIKNLIGIIDNPIHEDLLFEIISFLADENRYDGEFRVRDAALKTRVRITSDLQDDIDELVTRGYIQKLKYTSYKVIKHNWEI